MADKIRFTFFHKRVHPFLIILAVIYRAAHALNALEFVRVHGVCFAQHAQFFFDDGDGQRLEKRPRHSIGARLDWAWGPWTAGLLVTSTRGQLLASTVPGQPPQPAPTLTLLGAQAQWQITPVLELGVGVDNLNDTRLSEKSPLFTYAEPPRTWRLALRARW